MLPPMLYRCTPAQDWAGVCWTEEKFDEPYHLAPLVPGRRREGQQRSPRSRLHLRTDLVTRVHDHTVAAARRVQTLEGMRDCRCHRHTPAVARGDRLARGSLGKDCNTHKHQVVAGSNRVDCKQASVGSQPCCLNNSMYPG